MTENVQCTVCSKTNTELAQFKQEIPGSLFLKYINFKPDTTIKKLVYRYVTALLKKSVTVDVYVCQGCTSKIFRSCVPGK
jgi:hypothetical protein